jgi:transcriptional regulator with XRE-family HTH domain
MPGKRQGETFGGRVAQLRRNRKLSQEALSERAGISRGYLARLETDVQEPTLSILRKLAAALDVPIADLVEGTR